MCVKLDVVNRKGIISTLPLFIVLLLVVVGTYFIGSKKLYCKVPVTNSLCDISDSSRKYEAIIHTPEELGDSGNGALFVVREVK